MTPPTDTDLHRDIGRMEGRLDAMEERFDRVEKTLERIDTRLAEIIGRDNERKGAWLAIVTIATALGAIAGTIAEHIWK
jgi:hypothetical protein